MPAPLKVQPHLSLDELRRRAADPTDPTLQSHYRMILLVAEGQSVSQTAAALGFARQWVARIVHRYNGGGPDALGDQRHNNEGRPSILDDQMRGRLRQLLADTPREHGGLTGPQVARWLEKNLGHRIHVQRVYEWAEQVGYPIGRQRTDEE